MVMEKPQSKPNRRRKSYGSGHGSTRATARPCPAGLPVVAGRVLIPLKEVSTLFIAHYYRMRDRRHRVFICTTFEHKIVDLLLDGRKILVSEGKCWLNFGR